MLKIIRQIVAIVFLATALNACATVGASAVITTASVLYERNTLSHKARNHYISMHIDEAIEEHPELKKEMHVVVASQDYTVLLTGQVPDQATRQKVIDIARSAPSVKKLIVDLKIAKPTTVPEQIEDTWITTKIRAKLVANSDINPSAIKVVTENRTVYLIGYVTREQEKITLNLVKNTNGVKRVMKSFKYLS